MFRLRKKQIQQQHSSRCVLAVVWIPGYEGTRKKQERRAFFLSAELKPTCADGLIPAPLSITLTTANGDIQATGQRESRLAAHFEQGRKGLSGREEAGH